jgi:hypothetical protein
MDEREEMSDPAEAGVRWIARFGYFGKGTTYVLVGGIALWAALLGNGDAEGSSGTLQRIAAGTWGCLLIAAVAVGLAGYSFWNFWRAFLDPECKNNRDNLRWGMRGFFLGSALIHAGLAFVAARAAWVGARMDGSEETQARTTAGYVMSWPGGWMLVAAAGVGMVVFAGHQLYKATFGTPSKKLAADQIHPLLQRLVHWIGRIGYAARGTAFGTAGVLTAWAAWQVNAADAGGLEAALDALGESVPWLLGVIATGLAAYGLFMYSKALFRRMAPDPATDGMKT